MTVYVTEMGKNKVMGIGLWISGRVIGKNIYDNFDLF